MTCGRYAAHPLCLRAEHRGTPLCGQRSAVVLSGLRSRCSRAVDVAALCREQEACHGCELPGTRRHAGERLLSQRTTAPQSPWRRQLVSGTLCGFQTKCAAPCRGRGVRAATLWGTPGSVCPSHCASSACGLWRHLCTPPWESKRRCAAERHRRLAVALVQAFLRRRGERAAQRDATREDTEPCHQPKCLPHNAIRWSRRSWLPGVLVTPPCEGCPVRSLYPRAGRPRLRGRPPADWRRPDDPTTVHCGAQDRGPATLAGRSRLGDRHRFGLRGRGPELHGQEGVYRRAV